MKFKRREHACLETKNLYSPQDEVHYIGLVQMLNLAEARGVHVNLDNKQDVLEANQQVRQHLLKDYANCKLQKAQAELKGDIKRYKSRVGGENLQIPFALTESSLEVDDFIDDARIDLESDLRLIPKDPSHPNPLVEYYKFHEK